jgi:NAD(P)H-hydrate epimerase
MSARSDVPPPLPALSPDAHKGDAGRALCVAGSRTMPGAAILVARAAQRAGAGLVSAACLDPGLLHVLPLAAPEAVLVEAYAAHLREHAGDLGELLDPRGSHARLLGPGIGDDERARFLVRGLVASAAGVPLVLDADALNALDGEPERLRAARGPVVITPHPGEAGRLLGAPVPRDDAGRAEAARALARRSGAVVCLKGRGTVVTDGERVAVNATGNPGMATAGAGDVLAGMLVAYLARAQAALGELGAERVLDVARLAVHVHGLAGDRAAAELGRSGVVASDLVDRIPAAQRTLEEA